MNGLLIEFAAWLSDFYLLSTILLAAVFFVGKVIGQPARRIAIAWSAALGLVALAVLCAAPDWSTVHVNRPTPLPMLDAASLSPPSFEFDVAPQSVANYETPELEENSPAVATTIDAAPAKPIDWERIVALLMASGSALVLMWLAAGAWQAGRLRRRAISASAALTAMLAELTPDGKTPPQIGVLAELPVAVAFGVRRPMILLPSALADRSQPEKLRSVLAHELAHIEHRDLWLLALLRGLLVVLWAHPLVWLWRRMVRLDQETLADAAAAEITNRSDYAEQLVAMAREDASVGRRLSMVSSVGLWENASQLKRRVAVLLDEKLMVLRSCTRRWRVGSALLLLLTAAGLSLITLQPKESIAVTEATASSQPESNSSFQVRDVDRIVPGADLTALKKNPNIVIAEWANPEDAAMKLSYDNSHPPLLQSSDIATAIAKPSEQRNSRYDILIELTPAAGKQFKQDTNKLIGSRLAIMFGGKVLIAPRLHSAISNSLRISGGFNKIQAEELAERIKPTAAKPQSNGKRRISETTPATDSSETEPNYLAPVLQVEDASSKELHEQQMDHSKRLHQLLKPNMINGICLDEKGQPLVEVPINILMQRIDRSDVPRQLLTAKTNSRGEFRFVDVVEIEKEFPEGIPEEHFQPRDAKVIGIVGRAAGRVPGFEMQLETDVARNGASMIWVMLPAETLHGRVIDEQGQPVVGTQITTEHSGSWGGRHGINSATTDSNGEYAIADLTAYSAAKARRDFELLPKDNPDTHWVSYKFMEKALMIRHPDFAAKRAIIQTIPGNVDVQLSPGSFIEGKIKLPESEVKANSIAGRVVRLQRVMPQTKLEKHETRYVSFQTESTTTDEKGHYRIESLPAGKYHLTAEVKGWVTQGVENVEVTTGETATAPDILFTRGGRVRVQLIDDETGEPMRFDEPTKGYINPFQRPQRAAVFSFRNSIVAFSTEGVGEIQLAAGNYSFLVSIPSTEDGDLTGVMSKNPQDWPTYEVKESEVLEISMRLKVREPLSDDGTWTTTEAILSTSPSDESDEKEPTDGLLDFIPATPVVEDHTESQELLSLAVQVVNELGEPVAGAKITPWALRSSQGHGHWSKKEGKDEGPTAVVTDADGLANVLYPRHRYWGEKVITTAVSLWIDHPEYGYVDDMHIDVPLEEAAPYKITLVRGISLEVRPTIDGKPTKLDNIYAMWSDGRSWLPEVQLERTEEGALQIPAMKPGPAEVRLVRMEREKATHFSEMLTIDLKPEKAASIDVPLRPAQTIRGKLSDNVPRPVLQGRIKVQTIPKAGSSEMDWFTWVPVQPDGTFTIESWPTGEAIQLTALCDGFLATSGTAPQAVKNPRDPKTDPYLRPQVFEPTDSKPIEVSMTALVRCVVDVVDNQGNPVADLEVGACPNVGWWNGGSQIYCSPLARRERLLEVRSYTEAIEEDFLYPFSAETDTAGRVALQLPAGRVDIYAKSEEYETPILLGRRRRRVQLVAGKITNVKLIVQPKGTEQLGDWDKLAGIVFGCSTIEGKRVCALPGVTEKIESFRKRLTEAEDPFDPALLAEAYQAIAEVLDDAGDAKEAANWRRKSAEQAAKIEGSETEHLDSIFDDSTNQKGGPIKR